MFEDVSAASEKSVATNPLDTDWVLDFSWIHQRPAGFGEPESSGESQINLISLVIERADGVNVL